MAGLAIYAERARTPLEEIRDAVVVVEGGRIAAVGKRGATGIPPNTEEFSARGLTVVPGFIDVHIHGAGGHDVTESTRDALAAVASAVARHGTTALVATTVTASDDQICRSAAGIAQYTVAQTQQPPTASPAAEVLGIHFEGPFISPARRGVHPAEWIARPSASSLRRYLDAAQGTARILTLAPELPGALDLIKIAQDAGSVVAVGHYGRDLCGGFRRN